MYVPVGGIGLVYTTYTTEGKFKVVRL